MISDKRTRRETTEAGWIDAKSTTEALIATKSEDGRFLVTSTWNEFTEKTTEAGWFYAISDERIHRTTAEAGWFSAKSTMEA